MAFLGCSRRSIDDVDHLVSARVDDADLIVGDEVTVVAVVLEEGENSSRNGKQTDASRNVPAHVVIEARVVNAGPVEVEAAVEPLAVLWT